MLTELDDYDWECAFSASAGTPQNACSWFHLPEWCLPDTGVAEAVTREDVATVDAISNGENDGPEWLLVAQLHNGLWFFLAAGCDYTGWDCQSGGRSYVARDKSALPITTEDMERLYPLPVV
jgi:hypothetical protein